MSRIVVRHGEPCEQCMIESLEQSKGGQLDKESKVGELREYIDNTIIPGKDLLPICKLNEVGLNRLLSHFKNGFIAVSAYLEKLPLETNRKNTELLKNI